MKKRLRHERARKAKETRRRSRGKKTEIRASVPSKRRVPRRLPRVPPPESEVWPEECRGENWKPIYAILFAGKCQLCAHSCPLPKSRRMLDKWSGMTRLLHCTNYPAHLSKIGRAHV